MANNSEPTVAVRFGVKDAEVIRQALKNLGNDGEAALRKFNAASGPLPKSLTAVSDVVDNLRGRAASLAGSTGIVGTALLGLGPVGLSVAAALGAVYLAFEKISEGNKAFGMYARDVRDFANATNFSTVAVQALSDVFQQNGISTEKSRAGLEKFAVAREQARKGDGELYDSLRKTNAALAEEFAAAQSAPAALGVFTKALQQADDTTRAFLARAAFGRGGVAFAQGLLDVAGRGGLGAIEAAAIKTGAAFDDNIIQKQAQAAVEAERKAQIVERNWNAAYANIYRDWKDFKKNVLGLDENNSINIAIKVRMATERDLPLNQIPDDTLRRMVAEDEDRVARIRKYSKFKFNPEDPAGQLPNFEAQLAERRAELERRADLAAEQRREAVRATGLAAIEKPRSREDDRAELERKNKEEAKRLAVLGDTASATELLRNKDNELRLARLNNVNVSQKEIDLAKESYAIQIAARDVALHSQLGVATATELYTQKLRELNQQLALRKLSEEQYRDALALSRKEIDETIKAQEVRRSDFPQLTKLRQEGENLKASLDTEVSGALRGATSDILALAKGTETASQAAGNFSLKMAEAVAQAMLMKNVIGPISGSLSKGLSSLFGAAGGGDSPTGGLYPSASAAEVKMALGGVFGRGVSGFSNSVVDRPTLFKFASGAGMMGEAGPEAIVPLRRGAGGRLGIDAAGLGGGSMGDLHIHNNLGVEATARREQRPDGGLDVILDAIETRTADRAQRGRGAMSKLLPRAPLRG